MITCSGPRISVDEDLETEARKYEQWKQYQQFVEEQQQKQQLKFYGAAIITEGQKARLLKHNKTYRLKQLMMMG
jgi:hypothetical protein